MRIWFNNLLDNSRNSVDVAGNRVRIGKNADNDIILNSPFVAGEAAVLYGGGAQWELVALGRNGCQIGDAEVKYGERRPIPKGEIIKFFPFTLTIDLQDTGLDGVASSRLVLDQEMALLIREVHLELLDRMDLKSTAAREESEENLLKLEENLEEIARLRGFLDPRRAALVEHIAGQGVRRELLSKVVSSSGHRGPAGLVGGAWSRVVSAVPDRERELRGVVEHVSLMMGLNKLTDLSEQSDKIEEDFWPTWDRLKPSLHDEFQKYTAFRHLKKEIKDIIFGYGPLEDLLQTPTISEIMVVDREHIYVEKHGVVENSGRQFISDEVTLAIIERIVAQVGRRIDKSSPLVDARLRDGSRVNAVIPPLAVSGPCLTIRKFPNRRLHLEDLVAKGALTPTVAEFLRAAVLTRRNILISGGTGTGKTTLLNCLSDCIPDKERIVTVEDTAELQLHKDHVVRLETKPANLEGAGEYTIRDLVKNALRMRPDRIIVGECRGAEALDMLQAMNTGHDGSMTTLHANNAADVVLRLEVLVQMAADLNMESIHRQIASAIDLVIQLTRMRDGSRKISQVTQFVDVDEEQGGVRTKDIFLLEESEEKPMLMPTGCLPTFMDDLIASGRVELASFYR